MSSAPFRVFSGLFCSLGLVAQTPPPAAASGAIAGVVIDHARNAPLRRAVVTLSTVEAQPQDAVAWTDTNGRFAFGYLTAGRYELRVTKNGYQSIAYGTDNPRRPPGVISLAAGEVRGDFVFRMQRVTSVSGVVLDQDGEPAGGVLIGALRQGWRRQKRELLPGPTAVSDADGRYRITGLTPGRYAILATASRPVLTGKPEVTFGSPERPYVSGPQYYPGTDRAASAALIGVEAGQDYQHIDFRLEAHPVTTVQGKVVLPAGVTPNQVSITATSMGLVNRMSFGAGVGYPDHTFHFEQLPPGSYKLIATAEEQGKRYRGVQDIEVGSQDLRDLTIALEPGVDLAGSVSIAGPDAAKFSATFVALTPGDGIPWDSPPFRANVGKDGRFVIAGVPPGVWDIDAGPIPKDGYIQSMYLGAQDVLAEEMLIRPSTSEPLKIVLGTQAASLSGDVTGGDQPARAVVLAAPDGKFRHVLSFYRSVATDGLGHFQIKGLTPGNYKLFAFEEFDPQSIQDPEFLGPFDPAGVAVTLREGENPSQKLQLIPAANSAAPGGRQ